MRSIDACNRKPVRGRHQDRAARPWQDLAESDEKDQRVGPLRGGPTAIYRLAAARFLDGSFHLRLQIGDLRLARRQRHGIIFARGLVLLEPQFPGIAIFREVGELNFSGFEIAPQHEGVNARGDHDK
jgi:hypothetical protein